MGKTVVAPSGPPPMDKDEMLSVLTEISEFTHTPEFIQLLKDLYSLADLQDKYAFVRNVVINKAEQEKRGIFVGPGVFIQRSYFTDNRPTLFCVVKYLKDGVNKLTFTYDDGIFNGSGDLY